ncbi:MAG: hypothetical protein FJX39_09865 [Alphaproteobacteria bacterium]|nr:hypothetical protein [Alphaproteobacteria bacterium]
MSDLENLISVVKLGKATLWLPEQTKREFWRNREKNIKKSIQEFEQGQSLGNAPLLVRENAQFGDLVNKAKEIDEIKRNIAKAIKSEIDGQITYADKIIRKIFEISKPINTDDETIFNAAWRRAQCHLPPGKNDDIGDRLCWVGLLKTLPDKAALHIVSNDTDYKNEGFYDGVRPYLEYEWRQKKNGEVKLWERISQFLSANFPDAENAIEMERLILANSLKDSFNYANTHQVIAQLLALGNFNSEQSRLISEAVIENSQVRDIRFDDDVKEFYIAFIESHKDKLDAGLLVSINKLYSKPI